MESVMSGWQTIRRQKSIHASECMSSPNEAANDIAINLIILFRAAISITAFSISNSLDSMAANRESWASSTDIGHSRCRHA